MSKSFGNRLKMALKHAGYSQKKATEELELSKNAITNYVAGRIPETMILYKLANLCSVSMEWLLTGEHPTYKHLDEGSPKQSINLSNEEIELLQKFSRLNEREKGRVEGLIDGLLTNDKRGTSYRSTHGEEAATSESETA